MHAKATAQAGPNLPLGEGALRLPLELPNGSLGLPLPPGTFFEAIEEKKLWRATQRHLGRPRWEVATAIWGLYDWPVAVEDSV